MAKDKYDRRTIFETKEDNAEKKTTMVEEKTVVVNNDPYAAMSAEQLRDELRRKVETISKYERSNKELEEQLDKCKVDYDKAVSDLAESNKLLAKYRAETESSKVQLEDKKDYQALKRKLEADYKAKEKELKADYKVKEKELKAEYEAKVASDTAEIESETNAEIKRLKAELEEARKANFAGMIVRDLPRHMTDRIEVVNQFVIEKLGELMTTITTEYTTAASSVIKDADTKISTIETAATNAKVAKKNHEDNEMLAKLAAQKEEESRRELEEAEKIFNEVIEG